MSVVVINALEVPEEAGPELERRFAARKHSVDSAPGFEGFQLLRPKTGQDRYLVVTQWARQEDYEAWREARQHDTGGHGGATPKPVATGNEVWELEVVDL